jgi:hypothetical protein
MPLAAPNLEYVFTATVDLAAPIDMGTTDGQHRRIVPITGGLVSGPRLGGIVLAGGADWQAVLPDGSTRVSARYTLRATDGTPISVRGPADVLKRLAAGEPVDRRDYYFRTAPQFQTQAGPHHWLAESLFVGSAARLANQAIIDFYIVG